jgi:hypothetical protein
MGSSWSSNVRLGQHIRHGATVSLPRTVLAPALLLPPPTATQGRLEQPLYARDASVCVLHVGRYQHLCQPLDGHWNLQPVLCPTKGQNGCTLPDLRGLNTDAYPPLLFSHAAQFPKLFTKVRNDFLSIKGHQQSDSLLSASTTTSSRLLSTEEHRPLASFSISPSLAPLARPTTSLSGYVAELVLHLPLPSTDSHRVHRLVGQP